MLWRSRPFASEIEEAQMAGEAVSGRVARRMSEGNPGGLLYGAILTGAVMSATAGHVATAYGVIGPCLFVVSVYWLADVYVSAFAAPFRHGRSPLSRRLRAAARDESRVLLGGVPALVLLVVTSLFGAGASLAVDLALWLTVVELGAVAFLAGRFVGNSRVAAFRESLAASLLGVLMVVAKSFLH
jgi:hypothetical protein